MFVVFIVACVAASRIASGTGDSNDQAADTSASFSAIWTALLLIFISVLGTIIMRRVSAMKENSCVSSYILLRIVPNCLIYWFPLGCYLYHDPANVDYLRHIR